LPLSFAHLAGAFIIHYSDINCCKQLLSQKYFFLVYVDIGNQGTDTANLAFTFTTTTTTRNWEIKVTQVECSNPGRYKQILIFPKYKSEY
jgi:hypothetical protein